MRQLSSQLSVAISMEMVRAENCADNIHHAYKLRRMIVLPFPFFLISLKPVVQFPSGHVKSIGYILHDTLTKYPQQILLSHKFASRRTHVVFPDDGRYTPSGALLKHGLT